MNEVKFSQLLKKLYLIYCEEKFVIFGYAMYILQ